MGECGKFYFGEWFGLGFWGPVPARSVPSGRADSSCNLFTSGATDSTPHSVWVPNFSLLCLQPKEMPFDSGKLFPHPHALGDYASHQTKSSCGPGFWNKEAEIPLPLYSFLEKMKPKPGISLMWDKREGDTQEKKEANILNSHHHICLQKELQFLL